MLESIKLGVMLCWVSQAQEITITNADGDIFYQGTVEDLEWKAVGENKAYWKVTEIYTGDLGDLVLEIEPM